MLLSSVLNVQEGKCQQGPEYLKLFDFTGLFIQSPAALTPSWVTGNDQAESRKSQQEGHWWDPFHHLLLVSLHIAVTRLSHFL